MEPYPFGTINHGVLLFNRKVVNTNSYTKFAKVILESYEKFSKDRSPEVHFLHAPALSGLAKSQKVLLAAA